MCNEFKVSIYDCHVPNYMFTNFLYLQVFSDTKFPVYCRDIWNLHCARKKFQSKASTNSGWRKTICILVIKLCLGHDKLSISLMDNCNVDVRTRGRCLHHPRLLCPKCHHLHHVPIWPGRSRIYGELLVFDQDNVIV